MKRIDGNMGIYRKLSQWFSLFCSQFSTPNSQFSIFNSQLKKFSILLCLISFVVSCSTEKNTAATRRWHSFNAKYNTYYNGTLAYIDGSLEKENGNVDNFTEIIPLYTVGNKNSKEIGKGNYERAIEKSQKTIKRHSIKKRPEWTKNRQKTERDIEWLNRKEYNPFLWKAWMLMGRSQFMKGSFDEAASTFSYISRLYSTQPAIYGKARAWLAKCYIEQDWVYDAEDVITKMSRDSIHWQARKEWDNTMADYYIHTGKYKEAVPYLRKMIRHEMRRKQKAREWYLMGQIQASLGNKEEAYNAFKHVVRLNPPYLLEFNARIAMTEVMAGGKPKQMISKLKRMAASDKNKDYLDQVYYALGNIYMMQKDTASAIAAYEKGNEKATRSGIEKGVLLLRLGDLYWTMEKFSDARRCYGEAIGLLDKERDDYEQLSERSKVLDELVPFTEAVELQDSLQELAKMPEEERNAAIDRVIEELKKKEKEEKRKQEEAEAEAIVAKNSSVGNNTLPNKPPVNNNQQQQNGPWYFYNTMAVNQGKAAFQKQWGKRENVDDWQRANKTVVAGFVQERQDFPEEATDSIMQADETVQDSLTNETDSAQFDPHKREYYLAQIPFTEEQVAASNLIIMDGLYNSGVIFKDKLNNLPLSEKQLIRLYTQYPDFEQMDNTLYHLFLLYSRKGEHSIAATYLDKLKEAYPESPWTVLLSDPYYEENARFGVHKEDSLYAATYNAFKAGRYVEVKNNTALSEQRFPLGENRDKFIFINGLGKLNDGDSKGCLEDMQIVVENYPQSEVSPMAGMIINGVKEGRSLQGGQFDIGDIWARRSVVLNDSDSIAARKFLVERDVEFVCMLAYEADSVDENRLLFEVARYNFTNFLARNFEISFEEISGLHRMLIRGFRNYDEALQYMRRMYQNSNIANIAHNARAIIISEKNMELLGTMFSYNDYDKFYEEHFMPLKISTVQLLIEPTVLNYDDVQEAETETDASNDDGGYSDDLYNGGVIDDNMLMDIGIEEDFGVAEEDAISIPTDDAISVPTDDGFNIPADDSINIPADDGINIPADDSINIPADDGINIPAEDDIVVPAETEKAPEAETKKKPLGGSAEIRAKMEEKQKKLNNHIAKQQSNKAQQSNQQSTTTQQSELENEFVIEVEDKSQEVNIEDEYYELEGF